MCVCVCVWGGGGGGGGGGGRYVLSELIGRVGYMYVYQCVCVYVGGASCTI